MQPSQEPAKKTDVLSPRPTTALWRWRLLCGLALVDGVAVFSLWGVALLRSAAALDSAGGLRHLVVEALLCAATLATVVGLLRGRRGAIGLAMGVLAALLQMSLGTGATLAQDLWVLALVGGGALYGALTRPRSAVAAL